MAALDKTEAVNLMLAAAGEDEVSAGEVTTPTEAHVKLAVRILDDVLRKVQLGGWSFNRDLDVELTPAGGEIVLAANVINVEPILRSDQLAIRKDGGSYKLYDREDNTFTFSGSVRVNLVKELAFDDLPVHGKDLVTSRATRYFVERYLGESQPALERDEARAQAIFDNAETEAGDYRLTDEASVWRGAGRRSPLDQYSSG